MVGEISDRNRLYVPILRVVVVILKLLRRSIYLFFADNAYLHVSMVLKINCDSFSYILKTDLYHGRAVSSER